MTRKQNPNIEQKSEARNSANAGHKAPRDSADTPKQLQAQQRQDEDTPNRQRSNAASNRGPSQNSGYEEQTGTGRQASGRSSDSSERHSQGDSKPSVRSPNPRDDER